MREWVGRCQAPHFPQSWQKAAVQNSPAGRQTSPPPVGRAHLYVPATPVGFSTNKGDCEMAHSKQVHGARPGLPNPGRVDTSHLAVAFRAASKFGPSKPCFTGAAYMGNHPAAFPACLQDKVPSSDHAILEGPHLCICSRNYQNTLGRHCFCRPWKTASVFP